MLHLRFSLVKGYIFFSLLITVMEITAISLVVAMSMATLCVEYQQPHFTPEKTDAQGGERTGPR